MKSKFSPWIIFISLVLVWGSSFIIMKYALMGFSAVQIGAARIIFASLFTSIFAFKSIREFRKTDILHLIIVAILGNSIPYVLFPIAINHIPSGIVGITNSMTPLFTLIVGIIAYRRKLKPLKFLGVFIGLIGTLILINPFSSNSAIGTNWPYILLALCAAACYGISINSISKLNHLSPQAITLFALVGASIPSIIILIFTDFSSTILSKSDILVPFLAVAFLGIFGTSLSMVVFNKLISITTPIFAASTTYVIPIVALVWGIIDGESLLLNHFLGMVVILLGVRIVNRN
ncbi:MAG: permease [Cryomorphaceae bacterium]|nr:permease [Cryomorphaceae bacterium]